MLLGFGVQRTNGVLTGVYVGIFWRGEGSFAPLTPRELGADTPSAPPGGIAGIRITLYGCPGLAPWSRPSPFPEKK